MEKYLNTLNQFVTEYIEIEDKSALGMIRISFDEEPNPFPALFFITDSRRLLMRTELSFELVIHISFTNLTPSGNKLQESMSSSKIMKTFENRIEGKKSIYDLKTANDVKLIENVVKEIIETFCPSADKEKIRIELGRTSYIGSTGP